MEQVRSIFVGVASVLLSMLEPINGFIFALLGSWAFNMIAGMRSDGVVITTCKNFSVKKVMDAFVQLFWYSVTICFIQIAMSLCGDGDKGVYAVKVITYIIMYVYVTNGLKNLVHAYPKSKALIIIYLFLRCDFKKMAPDRVKDMIEMYDEHEKRINRKKRR